VDAVLLDAFGVVQLAVAVMLGNVMTRILFRGWDRVKSDRTDWLTTAFYLGPIAAIVIVLIGSGS
jgi:hypothetical protein